MNTNNRKLPTRINANVHPLDQQMDFSSSDEDADDDGDDVSLNQIYKEVKNARANLEDARSENRDMNQKIMKLTRKISQFKSFVFSVSKIFSIVF